VPPPERARPEGVAAPRLVVAALDEPFVPPDAFAPDDLLAPVDVRRAAVAPLPPEPLPVVDVVDDRALLDAPPADALVERFDPLVERFCCLRVGVEEATCTCPFSKRTKGNRWRHERNYTVVDRAPSVTSGLRLVWMG
jgi:hypothetical protein